MRPRYKGVVIFGAPGSGKTTVARFLTDAFKNAKNLEASRLVIHPASRLEKLPGGEKDFIRLVASTYGRHTEPRLSRDQAREFFVYLKERYSPAVIAKAIEHIHAKKFPEKFMVLAGIRGYANSVYFKKAGYLVLYLKTPAKQRNRQLAGREKYSRKTAEKESRIEERIFSTNMVEKIAHLSFNTAITGRAAMLGQIRALVSPVQCRRCVNTSLSSYETIGKNGLCGTCDKYEKFFDPAVLGRELTFLRLLKGAEKGKYDALVGISGGKDSTATLYEVIQMGFRPLAFSLDTGYYPEHIFPRAKAVARRLGAAYKKFDIRGYIRPADRKSFHKTVELYDEPESEELKEKFRIWYREGRRHYSIKCAHAIPFVRTCQLCRRLTIRAYYDQAVKHGARVVILGMNEWAGLSQDAGSGAYVFSGLRRLKPFKGRPAVYVAHLPFLLRRRVADTRRVLKALGWKIPRGEELIESNANSCMFARAAESKARRMLGFHPDTTRLAREVTAGFITRAQAQKALAKTHASPLSVRAVLKRARVL